MRLILWMLLATALAPLLGNAEAGLLAQLLGEPAVPKLITVALDLSASPSGEDWTVYESNYQRLLQHVCPGDRVVLTPIISRPHLRAKPAADIEFPATGIRLNDEEAARRNKRALRDAFLKLKAMPREHSTPILETLSVVQPLKMADGARAHWWIVLLTDGRQESPLLNVERDTLATDQVRQVVQKLKSQGALPDLSGATVFVGGAASATPEKFIQTQRFWQEAFSQAGAMMPLGNYVRDGLRFPDPSRDGGCP